MPGHNTRCLFLQRHFLFGILPNLALFRPGIRHYTGGLHKSQAREESQGGGGRGLRGFS